MNLRLEPFSDTFITVLSIGLTDAAKLKERLPSLSMAIIDSRLIFNALQLLSAACITLAVERDASLLTRSIYTELLYRLSGSKNVRALFTILL